MSNQIQSTKSRATKEIISERLEKIENFLDNYPSLDSCKYFSKDEWSEIQENGITPVQLHTVMCGAPHNSKELGEFNEKLSLANFKKLLKTNNYTWAPYVVPTIDKREVQIAKHLYHYFEQNPYTNIFLECLENPINSCFNNPLKNDAYREKKFCISIYFESTKYVSAIAELLYDLFEDKILGITPGIGMLQIYVNFPIRAKNIRSRLITLINKGTWQGTSVE